MFPCAIQRKLDDLRLELGQFDIIKLWSFHQLRPTGDPGSLRKNSI